MYDMQLRKRAQLSDDIQHYSKRTRKPLNLRAVWKDDGRNVPHVMKVRTASRVCSFHLFLLIVTMVHTTETDSAGE